HAMHRGLQRDSTKREISGEDVFNLHTTYGFPPDLTRQMATEYSMAIDDEDYQRRMREHEAISKSQTSTKQIDLNVSGGLPNTDDRPKWYGLESDGTVLGWISDNEFHKSGRVPPGELVGLLLDKTCFYAEAGGQVGDMGVITTPSG